VQSATMDLILKKNIWESRCLPASLALRRWARRFSTAGRAVSHCRNRTNRLVMVLFSWEKQGHY